ncbi:Fruit bromelain [Dichanthelium oligosanthes]|uniref:Fruit bromelain n=1 Tax=Dichanthelium oligosanthes TaxID=888268 RepID=A0A1E5WMC2_9POAL|nr:Fruit bromelain [Dichanthelium oligosanthes]
MSCMMLEGPAGCGWAFAAVGAIEGLMKIKTGTLVELSKQQVVDFSPPGFNSRRKALDWVRQNGGVTTEANITGYARTDNASELALMVAVAGQPVAVRMSMSPEAFKAYKAGTIFEGPCSSGTNHAMLVVGYGTTRDRKNFWIVKNWYGPRWGDNGFVLVKRGVSSYGGLCGIADDALFLTM